MDEHVFDSGPQPPQRPARPAVLVNAVELPPGAEGDPAIEPETHRAEERYADFLKRSDAYSQERAAWEAEYGKGPVRIVVGSAAEAVQREPGRYSLSPGE